MKKIKELIEWLAKSFSNDKDGGSARKLSAFYAVVVMCGIITNKYTTGDNAPTMLLIWLSFAGLCLGMVTVQQLIELKNGKNENKSGEPS